ncbi:MAG: energy-coupled thiamine transporter ThiT [Tissierellia bacterium]|nr:energy-coupled thiamine transporter ThiT [Tissierellia bacterium]
MKNKMTQMIVEGGIVIALAKILSLITLFKMPLGGSVTLCSRLPLIIFAIRWGAKSAFPICAIYGLVDMLIGGYIIHPMQAILDYILSYGAMCLSGLNNQKKDLKDHIAFIILAYIVSGLFNIISGYIFFKDMTTALEAGFKNFITYDIIYNYSFLLADMLILLIIFAISYKRLKALIFRK